MKNLMDDRGISPLVATVILIAITVAAAGSIAVIITRISPGPLGLAPVMSVATIYKDNDTVTTTYNTTKPYKIADDNAVYIRITHVAGGRVYDPTTDLTLSFTFVYDNRCAGADLSVSGSIGFPNRGISLSNCTVENLIASTTIEGQFYTGNMWLLKIRPTVSDNENMYAVHENTTVIATVQSGGRTPAASVTSSYWTSVPTAPG